MAKATENIAAYMRISVDTEADRDNTSIENQRAIIKAYIKNRFSDVQTTYYEDRDRSGYTFKQREGYQSMRPLLLSGKHNILIVKDLSRFSRRNSRGLVELEDLRDAGVRIISIDDCIDYPTRDEWQQIQFKFLMNEMPVTDASRKVKSVINRRQNDGKWICSVPFGYVITNTKNMTVSVDEKSAEIVRLVFNKYLEGWGYKKIANFLTDKNMPTPRAVEKEFREADGTVTNIKPKDTWSIATVQGILKNDFYIGTLRQRKYTRKNINGKDMKLDEEENIVFENHHEAIIDYRTFSKVQQQLVSRSKNNYRGVSKYPTVYSGFLFCGDCGSPMFSMSRPDLPAAYTCGSYHRRGKKGCSSHHIRVDAMDSILKMYVKKVLENSKEMIAQLEKSIAQEPDKLKSSTSTVEALEKDLEKAKDVLKNTLKQKVKEITAHPDMEEVLSETFDSMIEEADKKIKGIENQITLVADKRNVIIHTNRIAKTALEIFNDIINKPALDKNDLEVIINRMVVYEDHVDIELKSDIDMLIKTGSLTEEREMATATVNFKWDTDSILRAKAVLKQRNKRDEAIGVNVISKGEPLEIFTSGDGDVIFRKYSTMNELANCADKYAEVLFSSIKQPVIVCDRDAVCAAYPSKKKELVGKRISEELEEKIRGRDSAVMGEGIFCLSNYKEKASVVVPVRAAGSAIGCIAVLQSDSSKKVEDKDISMLETASKLLGAQTES